MRLQPNIGSDRSWVWKVAADYAESPPSAETLAIRFANAESKCRNTDFEYYLILSSDAGQFKEKFEEAQKTNASITAAASTTEEPKAEESTKEEEPAKVEEEKKEEESKPAAEEEKKEEEPKVEAEEKKED